jgi:threonine aldolase
VPLHGDGARLFTAIVATGTDPRAYGEVFTGFSFCLSKGLGAPIGSVVVGDADAIEVARHWRRLLGGAMRQVGVLAAAGRFVLAHHVDRLADDHANARAIAEHLADAVPGSCDPSEVETNIVYVETGTTPAAQVIDRLRDQGILVGTMGEHLLRLVTHLEVSSADGRRAAEVLGRLLREA